MDANYQIMGFTKEENSIFSQSVTLTDNFVFMIPNFSPYYLALVKKLQNNTPFTYIIRGLEYRIQSVEYELKNDYIITTFYKENKN